MVTMTHDYGKAPGTGATIASREDWKALSEAVRLIQAAKAAKA